MINPYTYFNLLKYFRLYSRRRRRKKKEEEIRPYLFIFEEE
jgi:hypothetical protein